MKKNNTKEEKIIDATGKTLGRVASFASKLLTGKNDPAFQRHFYSGCPVKIIHASKINISTKKLTELSYHNYSGYPGGLKTTPGKEIVARKGYSELLRLVIYQMLPGNKLRKEMMKNLIIEE